MAVLLASRRSVATKLRFLLRQRTLRDRIPIPHFTFNVGAYNDAECLSKFRFVRADINLLVRCFQLPRVIVTHERTRCSAVEAVCILLCRFAVSDRLIVIIDVFGRSPSAQSNIMLFVVDHLHSRFKKTLFLDRDRIAPQLRRFATAIKEKGAEIHNVWAFIDGTVRACTRPTNGTMQRCVYNGHKRKHALKFQTLVTPDGIIAHVFGPVEDRRYDLTILRRSQLERVLRMDPRFDGFIIHGDSAYGKSAHFASPFADANVNPAQVCCQEEHEPCSG
ncbi:hypothetical protein H257_04779 [Aphanomyces astaci]|uniref:DDE Tnp4 domain-containing protein n=1 Tax=Aphanomyces astaci TaxID=112090 RepID=W4GUQ0_APHAT|nr:hypothetical protein H257_04779 [Aphanomyces astaci]ETV83036.1 hypothetical protein H257_04779 [Aphanomyces astaci]|eukprot:XP_009827707.1 hypothetical protein H257_04779 [Aphanomyces astaci]